MSDGVPIARSARYACVRIAGDDEVSNDVTSGFAEKLRRSPIGEEQFRGECIRRSFAQLRDNRFIDGTPPEHAQGRARGRLLGAVGGGGPLDQRPHRRRASDRRERLHRGNTHRFRLTAEAGQHGRTHAIGRVSREDREQLNLRGIRQFGQHRRDLSDRVGGEHSGDLRNGRLAQVGVGPGQQAQQNRRRRGFCGGDCPDRGGVAKRNGQGTVCGDGFVEAVRPGGIPRRQRAFRGGEDCRSHCGLDVTGRAGERRHERGRGRVTADASQRGCRRRGECRLPQERHQRRHAASAFARPARR
jgi:hypothetical protein